jgi:hypothetical protein
MAPTVTSSPSYGQDYRYSNPSSSSRSSGSIVAIVVVVIVVVIVIIVLSKVQSTRKRNQPVDMAGIFASSGNDGTGDQNSSGGGQQYAPGPQMQMSAPQMQMLAVPQPQMDWTPVQDAAQDPIQ